MLASSREPCGVAGAPGRDLRPKSRRCAAVGLRNAPAGAVNPAPTNLPKRPVKPDGHGHPGGRRAGCPHPAGPCGGARPRFLKSPRCGGRERPPYGAGKTWWPTGKTRRREAPREGHGPPLQTERGCSYPGNRKPHNTAPPFVGADSISARGPCGGAGSPGGINPAPTNKFCVLGQPGRPRLSGET